MKKVSLHAAGKSGYWYADLPNGWDAGLWNHDGRWEFCIEQPGAICVVSDQPYARRDGALRGLNRLFRRVGWPYELAFPKTEKPKGVNT